MTIHFYSLFNSQIQMDESVLDGIPQKENMGQLEKTLSAKEIRSAINGMAYDKALGQSGVTTDMIKNLLEQALNLYVEVIQNFWQEKSIDFLRWHITILKTTQIIIKG